MFGMQIPGFMLKQMYRKGSLENHAEGFRFEVQNPLVNATIVSVQELSIGGTIVGLADVDFCHRDVVRPGTSVGEDAPVEFAKGDVVAILVKTTPLPPGTHPIVLKVQTEEFGTLKIEVEDDVRPHG